MRGGAKPSRHKQCRRCVYNELSALATLQRSKKPVGRDEIRLSRGDATIFLPTRSLFVHVEIIENRRTEWKVQCSNGKDLLTSLSLWSDALRTDTTGSRLRAHEICAALLSAMRLDNEGGSTSISAKSLARARNNLPLNSEASNDKTLIEWYLHTVAHRTSVTNSGSLFSQVLSTIHECMNYLREHGEQREAELYLQRYEHCLSRYENRRLIGLLIPYALHPLLDRWVF